MSDSNLLKPPPDTTPQQPAEFGSQVAYSSAPQQPGLYPPRQLAPWNGLAIASLVTSIIGLSLIAVILGHISLSQIKRTGEQGNTLAIVGLVLGYLGLAAVIVVAIFSVIALASGALIWNATTAG